MNSMRGWSVVAGIALLAGCGGGGSPFGGEQPSTGGGAGAGGGSSAGGGTSILVATGGDAGSVPMGGAGGDPAGGHAGEEPTATGGAAGAASSPSGGVSGAAGQAQGGHAAGGAGTGGVRPTGGTGGAIATSTGGAAAGGHAASSGGTSGTGGTTSTGGVTGTGGSPVASGGMGGAPSVNCEALLKSQYQIDHCDPGSHCLLFTNANGLNATCAFDQTGGAPGVGGAAGMAGSAGGAGGVAGDIVGSDCFSTACSGGKKCAKIVFTSATPGPQCIDPATVPVSFCQYPRSRSTNPQLARTNVVCKPYYVGTLTAVATIGSYGRTWCFIGEKSGNAYPCIDDEGIYVVSSCDQCGTQ